MTCQQVREEAALALLTGRPLPEDVSRHLELCPPCAQDVDELRPLPALLAAVDPSELSDADVAGELLLHRMLAEAARRQRRRRSWVVAAAVAAVAALVVAVPLARAVLDDPPRQRPPVAAAPTQHRASDPATGVAASVEVAAVATGSSVSMEVSGVAEGERCALSVVDASGVRREVATWSATYRGTASLQVDVAWPPERIAAVELRDVDTGQRLVAVPLAS